MTSVFQKNDHLTANPLSNFINDAGVNKEAYFYSIKVKTKYIFLI
ncbi:hypothetical protein [Bacillus pseudomycoides]|nr:hypothetical protein [Bacillus pseudomycoides]